MAQINSKMTSIEINGNKIDEISRRLDHLDGDYYISIEDAFRQVRKGAEALSLRLCEVENALYKHLSEKIATNAGENSESQDKILSGEFWDEIEHNNMFL